MPLEIRHAQQRVVSQRTTSQEWHTAKLVLEASTYEIPAPRESQPGALLPSPLSKRYCIFI